MANAITTEVLLDGARNAVVKVSGRLDTSDLVSTVVVDPAALAGIDFSGALKAKNLIIEEMNWSVQDGLSVQLLWEATTPVLIEELLGRSKIEARPFGGLMNTAARAGAAGTTGRIVMTTQGFAVGMVMQFSFLLRLVKQQN